MIPKVINYCWFGKKDLPADVKKCIDSWKKFCPDYKIVRWDESNFDVEAHEFTKKAYESKNWAFVSDYARLKVIYDNGGIYLDTDVELIKNIDFLLENKGYFGVQQEGNYIATGLGFGSIKGNKIVKDMLNIYDSITFDEKNKMSIACPILNTIPLEKYGYKYEDRIQDINGCIIFPHKYFDPIAPGNAKYLLCDDTISIHHYTASWTKLNQRIKRKIIRVIGVNIIIKIKERIKWRKIL